MAGLCGKPIFLYNNPTSEPCPNDLMSLLFNLEWVKFFCVHQWSKTLSSSCLAGTHTQREGEREGDRCGSQASKHSSSLIVIVSAKSVWDLSAKCHHEWKFICDLYYPRLQQWNSAQAAATARLSPVAPSCRRCGAGQGGAERGRIRIRIPIAGIFICCLRISELCAWDSLDCHRAEYSHPSHTSHFTCKWIDSSTRTHTHTHTTYRIRIRFCCLNVRRLAASGLSNALSLPFS